MDGPPAQSLGVEPCDPDNARGPPRRVDAPILSRELLLRVFTSAAIIALATLSVFLAELEDGQVFVCLRVCERSAHIFVWCGSMWLVGRLDLHLR